MPKTRFFLSAIITMIFLSSPFLLKAQIAPNEYVFDSEYPFPNIKQLCFEENFKERIKVTTQLDVTTLTLLEKLKFKVKTLNKRQREYIKSTGYPVRETTIRNWSKFFPKWYTVADKFKVDETGTYSYFITNNRLIPGGWVGSTDYIPQIGTYGISETQRGQRFYHVPFSSMAFEGFTKHTETVEKVGLLYRYRWSYPSLQVRTELMRQGYTVTVNTQYIRIQSREVVITYYTDKAIVVTEYYENQKMVSKVTDHFTYYNDIEQYLISKTIEIDYETFENGDCYEVVKETEYEEFAFDCDEEKEEEGVTQTRSKEIVSDFNIFPNPASHMLNIVLPQFEGISHIQVISATGQEINDMYINSYQSEAQIDIYNLPTGIYFINLIQNDKTFSKKFVKQ